MTTEKLIEQIQLKKSFLCVGLDTDLEKIPKHLLQEEDPIFSFNKAIIDATQEYCARYAKAFFEELAFDSITIAPYMGRDSVEPFLEFTDKHTILLALTSNQGAFDFQTKIIENHELYKEVLAVSKTYKNAQNLMYVVGATKAEYLKDIRKIIPDSFLLVPGVGAQGGNLQEVCKYGINSNVGLLVNSSRGIIYASNKAGFASEAAQKAKEIQKQMEEELEKLNQIF